MNCQQVMAAFGANDNSCRCRWFLRKEYWFLMTFMQLADAFRDTDKRPHLLTTRLHDPDTVDFLCYMADRLHFTITFVLPDKTGSISPEQIEQYIIEETFLISIPFANRDTATLLPVSEISEISRNKNIPMHVDASQVSGQIRIDMIANGIDILTISFENFVTPAVYFLAMNRDVLDGYKVDTILSKSSIHPVAEQSISTAISSFKQSLRARAQKNQRLRSVKKRFISHLKKYMPMVIRKFNQDPLEFALMGVSDFNRAIPDRICLTVLKNINLPFSNVRLVKEFRAERVHLSLGTGFCKYAKTSQILKLMQLPSVFNRGMIVVYFHPEVTDEQVGIAAKRLASCAVRQCNDIDFAKHERIKKEKERLLEMQAQMKDHVEFEQKVEHIDPDREKQKELNELASMQQKDHFRALVEQPSETLEETMEKLKTKLF